jgi:uncharacterized membrane protein YcfT
MNNPLALAPERVDWVDYAKGFCIIMVVMMHSTLGVELAAGQTGYMHAWVDFAKPFRMPDFFMISGLFLARVIDRDWKTYLDRKVIHFAYFYVLWVTIQFVFKAPGLVADQGWHETFGLYLEAFVQPFGTLWFIYLLPIFFVTVKLARNWRVPMPLVWLAAAALEIAPIETNWIIVDEFASRFVYFLTGYMFAQRIFTLAALVQRRWPAALVGLMIWAALNGTLVMTGASEWPFVSLGLGLVGAGAVVSVSALLANVHGLSAMRFCGQNSIVIYLAFFLPMAVSRTVLLGFGLFDIGTVSLLVTVVGVVGSLVIWWASRAAGLDFLFSRPARFHMVRKRGIALQPAE